RNGCALDGHVTRLRGRNRRGVNLRARGDGDLRGENKGLETGLARLAIETGRRICSGRLDAASCVSTQTMIDLKESQMGTTFAVRIHPRRRRTQSQDGLATFSNSRSMLLP